MKKVLYTMFVIFAIFFASCSNKKNEISLYNINTIDLDPTITWAVVIEPYVAFRKDASWASSVNDHCRLGDVLMIEGTAILDSQINSSSKEIWYRFDRGWLSESSISVYQNKLKAQKAASTLTK